MTERFDLVVAGGGAAGLSLALAIRSVAGSSLRIAVCDAGLTEAARGDSRAYAIVAGARRFFDAFGAWQAMAPHAEPMTRLEITDSSLEDIVRPALGEFAGDEVDGPFAHMLPNGVILAALMQRARETGLELIAEPVASFSRADGRIEAQTAGRRLGARLLVAADGRGSRLREQAGIAYFGWRYNQTAIVGTLHHSLPHEGVAVQHFLPAGPFAMLPLKGHTSSIVWNETPQTARRLLTLGADDLLAEVDRRAAGRFGTVTALTGVSSFPMSIGIARSFVAERFALVGDAAHGFHPIAGQGLNYGLRGAAALAEGVLDATRLGLDIGSPTVLEGYEQARRADVMGMVVATEGLNRLFSNDSGPIRLIRDAGMGLVQRLPGLKQAFMATAAGSRGLGPRAFRGLPL